MFESEFCYIRDDKKRPIITICSVKQDWRIAKGIAICSKRDQPNKKIGRNIAEGRALAAFFSSSNNLQPFWCGTRPIKRKEALQILKECNVNFAHKVILENEMQKEANNS